MQLIPVTVEEIPTGRVADTVTQSYLQGFLDATDASGNPLAGAIVTLEDGEDPANVRSKLQNSIEKNVFPIRVVSKTEDGDVKLFVKRDDSVVPEIQKRKQERDQRNAEAKAQRKAEREQAKNGNGATPEVASDPVEGEVSEPAKSGKRGR